MFLLFRRLFLADVVRKRKENIRCVWHGLPSLVFPRFFFLLKTTSWKYIDYLSTMFAGIANSWFLQTFLWFIIRFWNENQQILNILYCNWYRMDIQSTMLILLILYSNYDFLLVFIWFFIYWPLKILCQLNTIWRDSFVICRYQEILTDPSYAGQFVLMTNPHIGNTGVNFGVYFGFLCAYKQVFFFYLKLKIFFL